MTGLDTNVILRYFVTDDADQACKTASLIDTLTPEEPGWIGTTVLAELIWTLRKLYRFNRVAVIAVLEVLLASSDLILEQSENVQRALWLYRTGKADFADCLISASAHAAGCNRIVTLDQTAARDAGMELLA